MPRSAEVPAITPRLRTRYLIREALGVVVLAVLVFASAGRLDWTAGWALVSLTALWVGTTAAVILRHHPALIADRLGPKAGARRWDLVLLSLIGIAVLTRCVVAGLDVRYGWSGSIPPAAQIGAALLIGLGYALAVWAVAANAYFSQVVRIQEERDHEVATGGPYRFVRHPGYLGSIVVELAAPILLGSWWALLPGGLAACLFVARTALEDRTLQHDLAGYAAYAAPVRSRLLPGLW